MPAVAVGFDFDHTLGRDGGLETEAFYELARELGTPIDSADDVWPALIAELLQRFRASSITLETAITLFAAKLGVAAEAGHILRYRAICYALVDELVAPVEGARALLDELAARGIPTAILTNGWSPLQYLKIARALAYTGPVLVSDELGLQKPDAAAFGKLIDVLGVARAGVWYVGDNPKTDVAGAQAAGLRGVWFDRDGTPYPADAPAPNLRICSLLELLDALPGHCVPTEKTH